MNKKKIIRITTVPISLQILLKGQLKFMNQFYDVIAISSGPEKQLKLVSDNEGVKVLEVEMTRKITPIKDLISVWKLYKIFRDEKPSIVHSHTPKAGIVAMFAAYLAKVPYRLHTVAGLPLIESRGLKKRVLVFVEKLTYSFATKIYPNSNVLHQYILDHKLTKKNKLKVLGNGSSNGIDTSYYSSGLMDKMDLDTLKNNLGIKSEDTVFIFVGRLVGDKGINELIKAFGLLQKDFSNSKLLLVGPLESDLDPLLPETLAELYQNKNILNVGFQKDVRHYLAISNVLVFPSYREGFPNVVMQAGSMGLPSIVTNINGCNEIIIENKNGYIIPVKNTDELFNAMKRIIVNKSEVEILNKNARDLIKSRYEQKLIWQAIFDEYEMLK